MTHTLLRRLRGGLIVSCQAAEGSPLRDARIIAALARSAELGGAAGVRVDGPEDVASVRRAVGLPIIGLYKLRGGGPVYITPTFAAGRAVAEAGAEIVAVQATAERLRQARAGTADALTELIARLHSECGVLVMGDVSTVEEGLEAEAAGADIIGTTMSGYTPRSPRMDGPDVGLVRALRGRVAVPVLAEGRVRTPEDAAAAIRAGAWAVVVGRAITMPEAITEAFCAAVAAASGSR